ncbi:MAG: apolipoprotein N-acyltransferase, partial [Candidatus Tantalella remota]|nr:apolipoprotein N-acyltransferase [Candidatus Tantalella remota]
RGYIDKPIGDFRRGGEYSLFTLKSNASSKNVSSKIISRTNFYKFGVLICFEDIFPYLSREFVLAGANFLVNITNDAWFGNTAASRQHLQSSVFRAIENRVPVIRAANTGVSGFVDSTGKIISTVEVEGEEIFVTGVQTDSVNIYAGRSFYTVYGDVFVYFCGLMLLLLMIVEGASQKKERKP